MQLVLAIKEKEKLYPNFYQAQTLLVMVVMELMGLFVKQQYRTA
jgi:hypothetical protein